MARKKDIIYQSRWHLLVTLGVLIIPLIFLLLFSRFAHVATGLLFGDLFISITRLILAYFIAALLGWSFAVLFYRGKRAAVALPFFDVLQSFPTFALLPLATLFWGATNFTIIFFLVLAVIWPLFFSVTSSLKLIRHDWEEATEIYRLAGLSRLKYFLWPVSIPGFITGSIVGLGDGWEALIATEIIVGIQNGLGNFFHSFSSDPRITAFGVLAFLSIVFSINKLIWLPLLEWSHRNMEE